MAKKLFFIVLNEVRVSSPQIYEASLEKGEYEFEGSDGGLYSSVDVVDSTNGWSEEFFHHFVFAPDGGLYYRSEWTGDHEIATHSEPYGGLCVLHNGNPDHYLVVCDSHPLLQKIGMVIDLARWYARVNTAREVSSYFFKVVMGEVGKPKV